MASTSKEEIELGPKAIIYLLTIILILHCSLTDVIGFSKSASRQNDLREISELSYISLDSFYNKNNPPMPQASLLTLESLHALGFSYIYFLC